MINPRATDPLTLEERAELELQYDGPISEAAIQDKIRARGAAYAATDTAQSLTKTIAWARADLRFLERERSGLESDITRIMADREKVYGLPEWDRKTRHIASLTAQLERHKALDKPYLTIIKNAQAKLDALTLKQAAE